MHRNCLTAIAKLFGVRPRHAQELEPAPDMRLVVTIGVAEAPIEIGLFARNDGVAKCNRQRHCEQEYPGAAYGYADPDQEEKHCEIDGIAAPAVNPVVRVGLVP